MSGQPPTGLVDQDFHDAMTNPDTPYEEIRRRMRALGSLDAMRAVIGSYAKVEETKAPRPAPTDDVYLIEQGKATVEQFNEVLKLVKQEHDKKEGVVVMHIYHHGLGFVFSCPRDMKLIDPKENRFKDLTIAKNPELKQRESIEE